MSVYSLLQQANLYRSYVNDFITVDRWACYHGFDTVEDARIYLEAGRNAHKAGY